MRVTRSRWFVPLVSVALGLIVCGAQWIGGSSASGLESLAIMTAFAAVIVFGGRSETIRGLRGDGRDERFAKIDIHATALAGLAVIIAVIIGCVVELAQGRSGSPYSWLGAIAGITYLAAVVLMRIRS
jgi:hypothetical protein